MLHFGPFTLDAQREEVRRGRVVLPLPHQPFRVLLLLASHAGAVVTRDEIQRAIWGDAPDVDVEHGINAAIRQIRMVLGDDSEEPAYVRTVPRRGYSFIGNVKETSPGQWRRYAIAAGVVGVIVAIATARPRPSQQFLAIAPIRSTGTAIDTSAYREALRAAIAALPENRVTLLDDSASSRDATLLLETTVRSSPAGVRVMVSGVDAASKVQLWNETFERPAARADGMPTETAQRVLGTLAQRYLPPPRLEPPVTSRVSPRALALYRDARLEHARPFPDLDYLRTTALFDAAVREEPRFAEAWSGLGDTWCDRLLHRYADRTEAARNARAAALHALALQPHNAEAHNTLGLLACQYDFDLDTAEKEFRAAVRDDPELVDPHVNLACTLSARGMDDAALREYAIAQQLDPVRLTLYPIAAHLYFNAHRFGEAAARLRDGLAMRPDFFALRWQLFGVLAAERRWSEAMAIAQQLDPQIVVPSGPANRQAFLVVARQLEPDVELLIAQHRIDAYFVATYYGIAGDREAAIEWLRRSAAARDPRICYLMVDPRFEIVRGDPRLAAIAAQTGVGRGQ